MMRNFCFGLTLLVLASFPWTGCSQSPTVGNTDVQFCRADENCGLGQVCVASMCRSRWAVESGQSIEFLADAGGRDTQGADSQVLPEQGTPDNNQPDSPVGDTGPRDTSTPDNNTTQDQGTPDTNAGPDDAGAMDTAPDVNPVEPAQPDDPTQPEPAVELECVNAAARPCYPASAAAETQGKGICKAGTQTCTNNQWGACQGAITPQTESCNSKDDDCDGVIDETCREQCKNCSSNSDCHYHMGRHTHCLPGRSNGAKSCLATCTQDSHCPRGFTCRNHASDSSHKFCLPPASSSPGTSPTTWRWWCDNYTQVYRTCSNDDECGGRTSGRGGECEDNECTVRCARDSDCPQNPKNYYCNTSDRECERRGG